MEDDMILLTTPTGDIGHRVLGRLLDAGTHVRVIARDPFKLSMDNRIDVIQGSMSDADTIAQALPGVTRVFWLPPGDPSLPSARAAYRGVSQAFCDALPRSEVTRVVSISALGRGWPKPAGLVTATLEVDDMIARTGVHLRALTCASLMDNFMRQIEPIRATGMFYQPTPGDKKLPHVAKSDVARIAADLLLDTGWTDVQELPLLGPEDLSFDEMAVTLSESLGRPVKAMEMSMPQFEEMMRGLGASEGMAQAYVEMLTAKNEGIDTLDMTASRRTTPTTFREWCDQEFRALIGEI